MKNEKGWWWPDHEKHLPLWMDHPKNNVVMNGRIAYQGKKQQAVLALCTKQRERAIDVGGHVGLWSFNLAHHFSRVEAFEPVAAHRECFRKNLADLDNVTLYSCALGAAPGKVAMATEKGSSGNTQVDGPGEIAMSTLDSFEFEDVGLIKIDTEGYEENVLRGAQGTIARWKPVIIVEQKRDMASRFGLKPQGAVEYLRKDFGYRVAQEISGDYIMVP